jgi:hypothetical protein
MSRAAQETAGRRHRVTTRSVSPRQLPGQQQTKQRCITYNAVRDLARHMTSATQVHYDAILSIMKNVDDTSDRGFVLNPTRKWDGNKEHEFIISGRSDSNYAKDTQTRKSISR